MVGKFILAITALILAITLIGTGCGTKEEQSTADTVAPIISEVNVSIITSNSAVTTWTTDEPATSQIEYGLTDTYGSTSTLNGALVANHTVTLTGLSSETTYHFKVRSRDASDNEAISDNQTLTTAIDLSKLQGRILFCEKPAESSGYYINYSVYMMNANGNGKTRLLDFNLPKYISPAIAVSPDESRLAYFTSNVSEEQPQGSLCVFSTNSGSVVQLATHQLKTEEEAKDEYGWINYEDLCIAWSPDGTKIAYVVNRDLYVINADGSGQNLLYYHQGAYYGVHLWVEDQVRHITWSADGSHILFDDFNTPWSMYGGSTSLDNRDLFSIDPVRDPVRSNCEVLFYHGAIICSQPSGNQILVGTIDNGTYIAMVMNDDGSNKQQFSGDADFTQYWIDPWGGATWSPDGSMIVSSESYGYGIEIVDATTGTQMASSRKLRLTGYSTRVWWSSNSQYIACVPTDYFNATNHQNHICIADQRLSSFAEFYSTDVDAYIEWVAWL